MRLNTFKNKKIIIGLGIIFSVCMYSCKKEKYAGPQFRINKFKENIDSAFGTNVVGYGWAAYQNGKLIGSGGGGWARVQGVDPNPIPFTEHTVGTVFSTSKTITAAFALNLMYAMGISDTALVINYLPTRWAKHKSLDSVTLGDLLSHRSGMSGTFDRYIQMRDKIKSGMDVTYGTRVYANINYTLFRIILPYMLNKYMMENTYLQGEPYMISKCAEVYELCIKHSFEKINIPDPFQNINTYYPSNNNRTLYYDFGGYIPGSSSSKPGKEMFDCHDISGAGGWFMNAVQYAYFIDKLMEGKILSDSLLELMKTKRMAINSMNGEHGKYYWHNGGGAFSGVGGGAVWMYFPNSSISFFIHYNSDNKYLGKMPQDLAREIYDESFD